MTHPPGSHEDRLEDELRDWLRARDAGNAPLRLRIRVGSVVREARPRPSSWSVLRPVLALGSVAALALFGLAALALRAQTHPAASGTPASAAPEASPTGGPQLVHGLWPSTGPVLAVPVDGPALAALVLLPFLAAAVIIGILVRQSLADARRSASENPDGSELLPRRSRGRRLARLAALVLAVSLIVAGAGLLQFAQAESPLQPGSGSGVGSLGYRTAMGGGSDETYFPYVPGGEFQIELSLANAGELPLTVTSFDMSGFLAREPAARYISSVDILLPRGAAWTCDPEGCNQPFHPFELEPHEQTNFMLLVRMKNCPSLLPGPTPSGVSVNRAFLPSTGYAVFGELPFRYSVLGIERETDVRLQLAIGLVFGSDAGAC